MDPTLKPHKTLTQADELVGQFEFGESWSKLWLGAVLFLSLNLWRFEFALGGLSVTIEHGWASGLEWLRFSSANTGMRPSAALKTRAEPYFYDKIVSFPSSFCHKIVSFPSLYTYFL